MKITFLCASPKYSGSNSLALINQTTKYLKNKKNTYSCITLKDDFPTDTDALIIVCPLYVDGLPAQLVKYLENLASKVNNQSNSTSPYAKIRFYGIVQCGFAEGYQTKPAINQMEQFCTETGFIWSGGIGLGMGGMIQEMNKYPDFIPIKTPVINAIKQLTKAIETNTAMKDGIVVTQYNYSWDEYKKSATQGWDNAMKQNGIDPADVDARPLDNM